MQNFSKLFTTLIVFSLFLGMLGVAEAAPKKKSKKATYWHKINRADIGLSLGDAVPGGTFWLTGNTASSTGSLGYGYGYGGDLFSRIYGCKSNHCYVPTSWDLGFGRGFGLDSSTRVSMPHFGYKSDIAHLFYIAFDGYLNGSGGDLLGSVVMGFGANAGFMYPLLAISGYNPYLASNKPQPINLNLFVELGLGYAVNIKIPGQKSYYGAKAYILTRHYISPGFALGMNMQFKSVPDLELEMAFKTMPGWRNNLYTRIQYDFMTFGKNKKMGVHFLFDVAYLSVNTGLSFRF